MFQNLSYLVYRNFKKVVETLNKVIETLSNYYSWLVECGKTVKKESNSCNVPDIFYSKSTQKNIGHLRDTPWALKEDFTISAL